MKSRSAVLNDRPNDLNDFYSLYVPPGACRTAIIRKHEVDFERILQRQCSYRKARNIQTFSFRSHMERKRKAADITAILPGRQRLRRAEDLAERACVWPGFEGGVVKQRYFTTDRRIWLEGRNSLSDQLLPWASTFIWRQLCRWHRPLAGPPFPSWRSAEVLLFRRGRSCGYYRTRQDAPFGTQAKYRQ